MSKISDMLNPNFQNSKSQHSNQVKEFHRRTYNAQNSKMVTSFLKTVFET